MAKTITGNAYLLPSTAAINSTIRFAYASAPAVANGGLVVSGKPVTAQVSLLGVFSVVLIEGYYRVTVDDNPEDTFIIAVDDVTETVDIIDIITSAVGDPPTSTGSVPVATNAAFGKVKTDAPTSSNPIAITGWFQVADITALRALATLRNNKLALVWDMDGSGTFGIFKWNDTGTGADNPNLLVRPDDYVSAGSAGVWDQKL